MIRGVHYIPLDEVAALVNRSRQTLWRWRKAGSIPPGHRDRKGRVLFTPDEVDAIRAYELQVEPIGVGRDQQLRLFNGDVPEIQSGGNQ